MLESKSFNLAQPKRQDGWVSFQAWTRKWNRFFATIFCVLSFMLLFAIVIVNVIETEHDIVEDEPLEDIRKLNILLDFSTLEKSEKSEGGCVAVESSRIICEGMFISDIDQELHSLIKGRLCTKLELQLKNIEFPDRKFPQDWMTLASCSVMSLYILNSPTLRLMEGGVFDSRSFGDTTYINISNVSLEELGTDVLKGLSRLEVLEISELNNLRLVSSDFLEPVKMSLKSLIMEGVSLYNPVKLTGSQSLNSLETIDFSKNNFSDNLRDDTFKNLPHLTSLHLSSNGIQTLTSKVFDEIATTVRFINLRNNRLKTLPLGIFSNFRSTAFRILLGDNPWRCDCALVELKHYLIDPSTKNWFDDILICAFPILYRRMTVIEAPFCGTSGTTANPTTITEPTTKDSLTTDDIGAETTILATAEPIECLICVENSYEEINCTQQEERRNSHHYNENDQAISVRRQTLMFHVEQVEVGAVEIIVKNPNSIKYVVFWFSEGENMRDSVQNYVTNEKICAECTVLHENRYKVSSLKTDFLYIFCLMKYKSSEISPFDCVPYKTHAFPYKNSWLQRQDKILAYTISILSLLLCSFVGAFIMYCIIRKMPTLLKGSERVIIVKDKEVIIMPSGHKKLSKTDSLQSTSVETIQSRPLPNDYSAYLTPMPNKKPVYRKIHHRRASDSSLESIRSYISTKGPDGIQVNRLTCYSDFQGRCFMDLKDVPNTPPPLPQRRSIETDETVDYTSIAKTPDTNIYTPFDYGTTIAMRSIENQEV